MHVLLEVIIIANQCMFVRHDFVLNDKCTAKHERIFLKYDIYTIIATCSIRRLDYDDDDDGADST